MTKRKPVESAPGPLELYAARFDDLFASRAQREGFRTYLEKAFCWPRSATSPLPPWPTPSPW
jgi:hypothetical protein